VIKFLTASFVAATFLGAALYVLGTETEVMASASLTGQKADRLDIKSTKARAATGRTTTIAACVI